MKTTMLPNTYQAAGASSRCRFGFAFERVGSPGFESAAAQLFSLGDIARSYDIMFTQ